MWPCGQIDSATAAYLFRALVISRFGAPAEVLTDGGSEFDGEFAELMRTCLIDHRRISPGSPQSNGLAERVVQMCKLACAKIEAADPANKQKWDELLPAFLEAYRMTKHQSTKFSPFALMFAREPTVPAQLREKFDTSVEFDGSLEQVEFLATEYLERAALLVKHQALAMANLEIAQHRDKLRYAVTRSGAYLPRLFRFEVGDLVYIQREAKQATEPKTFPTVLVIVGFKDNGLAVLEGKDARQITVPVIRTPSTLPPVEHRPDNRPGVAEREGSRKRPVRGVQADRLDEPRRRRGTARASHDPV